MGSASLWAKLKGDIMSGRKPHCTVLGGIPGNLRTAVPGGLGPMSYCGLFAEDRPEGGEEALW